MRVRLAEFIPTKEGLAVKKPAPFAPKSNRFWGWLVDDAEQR